MKNDMEITIELTHANSCIAENIAKILKKPVEEILKNCLAGSTNPKKD